MLVTESMKSLSDEAYLEWVKKSDGTITYPRDAWSAAWQECHRREEAEKKEVEIRESRLYYLLSEWNRYYTAPDGNVKVFSDLVRDTQNILNEIGELYLNEACLAYQADQKE